MFFISGPSERDIEFDLINIYLLYSIFRWTYYYNKLIRFKDSELVDIITYVYTV